MHGQACDLLNLLFLNFPAGLAIVDLQGSIVLANPAFKSMVGSPDNLIGEHIGTVLPGSGALDVLVCGKPRSPHKMVFQDREIIVLSSPLRQGESVVAALVQIWPWEQVFCMAQEQIEELSIKNKELEAVFEASHDGIWISDGNCVTLRVNRAYEKFSGISRDELIGVHVQDLLLKGYISDSAALKCVSEKKPISFIQVFRGEKKALVTATPVLDEHGKIWRIISNVRDMSELEKLRQELEKAKELSHRYEKELEELKEWHCGDNKIIARSNAMRKVINLASKVAEVDSTVLILGESGVGKAVIARFIHNLSGRKSGPFIEVNCGALPETLLESELFGYEQGAFTGAKKGGKPGMFELAQDGTLFLDEIGELPLNVQVKLLHALQEGEIFRIGGTKPIKINTRIIAATNRPLQEMVEKGAFRKDLYYRLNVIPITIPPLRERHEDILPLINYFFEKYNKKFGKRKTISSKALDILLKYNWPGNVREVENLVERLIVISPNQRIDVNDLPDEFLGEGTGSASSSCHFVKNCPLKDFPQAGLKETLSRIEKNLIAEIIKRKKSIRQAAKELGIDHSSLSRKVKSFGLH